MVFLTVFRFFTLSRKPRRVFKSFLSAVARYTQILSPWRAMATPFVSKVTEKSRFSDPGVPGDPRGEPPESRGDPPGLPRGAGAGGRPGRRPGAPFWSKNGNRRFQYWTEIVEGLLNINISELISVNQRQSASIPGSRPLAAIRNLPSTRAGGQDDVSSQANSLKLFFLLFL